MDVRLLTNPSEIRESEHRFQQVFRDGNAFDGPIQPWVPAGALFASSWAFAVHDEQFEALVKAASATGDEFVYMWSTGWDDGERKFVEQLPRVEIHLRENSDSRIYHRVYEISGWIPSMSATPVILSRQGTWGILTEDEFAIAAGTQEFVDALGTGFDLDAGLVNCVNWVRKIHTRIDDTAWIPSLFQHVYGESQGQQILREAGMGTLLDDQSGESTTSG